MLWSECRHNVASNVPQFVLGVVTLMGGVRPGEAILTLLTQSLSLSLSFSPNTLHLLQIGSCHWLKVTQTHRQRAGLTETDLFLVRSYVSLNAFKQISLFVPFRKVPKIFSNFSSTKLERYFSPASLTTELRPSSNISTSVDLCTRLPGPSLGFFISLVLMVVDGPTVSSILFLITTVFVCLGFASVLIALQSPECLLYRVSVL